MGKKGREILEKKNWGDINVIDRGFFFFFDMIVKREYC